jgi:hypothetical protein
MINVQVSNSMLRVRLSGWDAFATCWRRSWEYEVPVSKIARVYVRPARPAIGIKSRTAWGPRAPEIRRIRARRPSLWVDLSGERLQRLAVSASDAEQLAAQICASGSPMKVRHGSAGALTASDISRLAAGELKRGD